MHARCRTRKKEKKGNQIAYYFPPVKKEIFENQILFYLPPQLTLLSPQEIGVRAIKRAEEQKKHIWETEDTSFFL